MKYKYISIGLIAISLLVLLVFSFNSENMGAVGIFLTWAYILLGIAVAAAVGIPLVYTIVNPKKLKKVGIYAGLAAVVLLLSVALSSSEPIVGVNFADEPASGTLRWTETGLIVTYTLLIVAFGSIITGGIINIRNR
jgi:asparagine N-glycosylation enzyme membrane subunit Stt3